MNRNYGEQPLCREQGISYLPSITPLSCATNMRSLHSEASTSDRPRPSVSAPCLTLTGTAGAMFCSRRDSHASTFLSPFPRRSFASRACRGLNRFGTMETLTPTLLTYGAGLPAYLATPFLVVPSPTTWAAWTSLPPRQRAQRFSDFTMNEQARRSSPPNRVRYPTDRQFALGCSPPRLAATQLPSATELWHTPTRTSTVLMWRPHRRTHPRTFLSGVELWFRLDSR
jgi:hypothetical protein